ncbi:sensor histidine kinase KdpD [Synechocystis sp. PCC 6714]|uniref:sensor histidine kinase n=1 Tax=Synechocystis sp. (strain PCC 6714) TaxID=1147 RepID=UPI0003F61959|nr:HAMP domain-containing sensor histidine kinase [Synechocystis sp. PCC 6714]AIE76329.1 two-component sensor histidine kinase [Synechocystis sp. PCC 6714]
MPIFSLQSDWQRTFWLIVALFVVVICLEYSTPPPYVFGYLYIGAVLLASRKLGRWATRWVTMIAILLTLLNLFIPGLEPIAPVTIANRTITVMALGVTGWLSDRLQFYEKEITYQQAQIMAQDQLARMREDFVSTLTHDLKTPLLGAIETLNALDAKQFGPVTPAQHRAIAIMARSHRTTLQLVETLMDVYRNDAEGLRLNPTQVDVIALAQETITQLTALAASRQVRIRLHQGESDFRQPCSVTADVLQLQRVFSNLIANAIHHSLRNTLVEVIVQRKGNDCIVQVADQGQGIASVEIPHLFDCFYQGDSNRQTKGTGLGLYLSRQIIEAHGGAIWAQARPTRGAIFAFRLPVQSQLQEKALMMSAFNFP